MTVTGASPIKGSVVTGPYLHHCEGRGLPTALPAVYRLALFEAAGEGFAVMSGSTHRIAPAQGNYSPDKEFRSSAPHVAMRLGPYLHLAVGRGGWRMASEDSQLLSSAMISSSLRRRLPPRFIGALRARMLMMPSGDRCVPDRTSAVISAKTSRS